MKCSYIVVQSVQYGEVETFHKKVLGACVKSMEETVKRLDFTPDHADTDQKTFSRILIIWKIICKCETKSSS